MSLSDASVKTKTLGSNEPAVTALGIGTWAWGDKLFWNYGSDYGSEQVREAFVASLDAGVNFFDTAEVYGLGVSEELLGQFIKETGRFVQIATKIWPLTLAFYSSVCIRCCNRQFKTLAARASHSLPGALAVLFLHESRNADERLGR